MKRLITSATFTLVFFLMSCHDSDEKAPVIAPVIPPIIGEWRLTEVLSTGNRAGTLQNILTEECGESYRIKFNEDLTYTQSSLSQCVYFLFLHGGGTFRTKDNMVTTDKLQGLGIVLGDVYSSFTYVTSDFGPIEVQLKYARVK